MFLMRAKPTSLDTIGVLFGGPGPERKLSLQTAEYLQKILSDKVELALVHVDTDGNWIKHDQRVSPFSVFGITDCLINTIHGAFGEDNRLHQLLHAAQTPYIGSSGLPSAITYSKPASKQMFKENNIKTPRWRVFDSRTDSIKTSARKLFRSFPFPAIIKPACGGAGIGVTKAETFQDLLEGLAVAANIDNTILIEEYVHGRLISCGVLEHARKEQTYILPPIHIRRGSQTYNYRHATRDMFAPLGTKETNLRDQITAMTKKAHEMLGLSHFSRADFIVSKKRGVYLLEMNAIPHMGTHSPYTFALNFAGIKPNEFGKHLMRLAAE